VTSRSWAATAIYEEAFATGAGSPGHGTYLTQNNLSPDQSWQGRAVCQGFTAKHGAPEPTPSSATQRRSTLIQSPAQAARQGKIQQAVLATKDFDSYLGPIAFDEMWTLLYTVTGVSDVDGWPPLFVKATAARRDSTQEVGRVGRFWKPAFGPTSAPIRQQVAEWMSCSNSDHRPLNG